MRGFTLVELMISMAIFGVISALVMVNFNAGNRTSELRFGAENMGSLIRDMETRASSGSVTGVCVPGSFIVPQGGYGVHFRTGERSVTTFADCDGNFTFDPGEEIAIEQLSSSGGLVIHEMAFDAGAESNVDLVFVPPRPTVYMNAVPDPVEFSLKMRQITTDTIRLLRYNRVSRRLDITRL